MAKQAAEKFALNRIRKEKEESFMMQQKLFRGIGSDSKGTKFSARARKSADFKHYYRPRKIGSSYNNAMYIADHGSNNSPDARNRSMANFGVLDMAGLSFSPKQDISHVMENIRQLTPGKRSGREHSSRGNTFREDTKRSRCRRGDLQLNQPFNATTGGAKYNLAPEFQHVRATYMNVDKAVEKLRKQKDERIAELREEKRIAEDRLPQWGVQKKKRSKSTAKAGVRKKQS